MGVLVAHLEAMLGRGCSEKELVRAVEDELSGGDLLDQELGDGPGAVVAAHERERLLGKVRRGKDTLACASRGGLYLPSELALMTGGHADEPGWVARESVRFLCFELVLRELTARVQSGRVRDEDYASAVRDLASRISSMRIYAGRRR